MNKGKLLQIELGIEARQECVAKQKMEEFDLCSQDVVDFRRKDLSHPRVAFGIGRGWTIERGTNKFTKDSKNFTMEAVIF